MFSNDIQWLLISSIATAAISGVVLSVLFAFVLKERSRSRYDSLQHQAVISEMRDAYERKLSEINLRLLSTEERFRDVNHLVISAQLNQEKRENSEKPSLENFLKNFGVSGSTKVDPTLIFVLTPFSDDEDNTYQIIREVCIDNGFNCVRGDEQYIEGDILSHIVRLITQARLVIANVSSRNANVFYELGIAHAMDKPTILISRTIEDVPFNLKMRRFLLYKDPYELYQSLPKMILRLMVGSERQPKIGKAGKAVVRRPKL
jgi:hypothetical protein